MATSKIGLPEDPALRAAHLSGLNSGLQGWDEKDVEAARPALEPYRGQFDGGRSVGLSMAASNGKRKRALQQGRPGLVHRIEEIKAAKDARKLPELP